MTATTVFYDYVTYILPLLLRYTAFRKGRMLELLSKRQSRDLISD